MPPSWSSEAVIVLRIAQCPPGHLGWRTLQPHPGPSPPPRLSPVNWEPKRCVSLPACVHRYPDAGPAIYDGHHRGLLHQPHAPADRHLQRQLGPHRQWEDGGWAPRAHAPGYGRWCEQGKVVPAAMRPWSNTWGVVGDIGGKRRWWQRRKGQGRGKGGVVTLCINSGPARNGSQNGVRRLTCEGQSGGSRRRQGAPSDTEGDVGLAPAKDWGEGGSHSALVPAGRAWTAPSPCQSWPGAACRQRGICANWVVQGAAAGVVNPQCSQAEGLSHVYLWPQFPDISAATDRAEEIRPRQSLQREGSGKTLVTMLVSSYTEKGDSVSAISG